jgi:ADP-heptose:LPS heptosyltransferase
VTVTFLYFYPVKILVVRFSSIGDVVLTTPIVRCLKQQLATAEIHFLTKVNFEGLLANNPFVDRVHTIQRSIDEVIAPLQAEKFDFVVDLHNNVRTLSLKRKLGVRSAAFPKKNVAKFLLTKFKIDKMPDQHVVDRYFEAVKSLGVVSDGLPGDFFLDQADEPEQLPFDTALPFVAVAIGAQFATKQLPIDLLEKSLARIDAPVVLLGGPMDVERSVQLTDRLSGKYVYDLCGKLSLRESAWVLSKAKMLLTGDTGLMHIAACFQIPVVSVWGNTVPAFGMYPYFPQNKDLFSIHEVQGLSCRPCSKIGYQACPKKHFRCMKEQNGDRIAADLSTRFPKV